METPLVIHENEHLDDPSDSRGEQDRLRELLQTLVRDAREACIVMRKLSPPRRWELQREVYASYHAVVLQMNAVLRCCEPPPDE
jgi:hypothetical protein